MPLLESGTRQGNLYFALRFKTRAYACFTQIHKQWYIGGVKRVPDNIYELLTPVALAHWSMGDGTKAVEGFRLATDSFTLQDTAKLVNVLILRYRLDVTIQIYRNKPRIYIKKHSMPLFLSIIRPYFHSSMLYKIS